MATTRDLMTSQADCLSETSTLVEAAGALARGDIGSMPVVGNGDELVGIITDRDIVVRAVAEGRSPDVTTVGEIVSADRLTTVSPNASAEEVRDCLSTSQVRRVPVVKDGRSSAYQPGRRGSKAVDQGHRRRRRGDQPRLIDTPDPHEVCVTRLG